MRIFVVALLWGKPHNVNCLLYGLKIEIGEPGCRIGQIDFSKSLSFTLFLLLYLSWFHFLCPSLHSVFLVWPSFISSCSLSLKLSFTFSLFLSLCRSLALSKSSSHPLLCLPFFPSFFLISYSSFFLSSFDSLNSPLLCIYDKLQAHDLKLYRNTDQMELATKAGAR